MAADDEPEQRKPARAEMGTNRAETEEK